MGLRGPAPMPTGLRACKGTRHKPWSKTEPRPALERPACPKWLDREAKRQWRRLIPQLELMKVLARVDRNALARYCQMWSRWKRAEEFLQNYGDTFPMKTPDGTLIAFAAFPQVAMALKLGQSLAKLEQEFGMTPSARTRIRVDHQPKPVNSNGFDVEKWMAGGGIPASYRRSDAELAAQKAAKLRQRKRRAREKERQERERLEKDRIASPFTGPRSEAS